MSRQKNKNSEALSSEVGSNSQINNMSEMWREFFNQQNNNMLNIIRSMQVPNVNESCRIFLPKFNPNEADSDADAWCKTANVIMAENVLEGSKLIMALSAALVGESAKWLTQISHPELTWAEFKEMFVQRFGSKDTSAAEIMKIFNDQPKPGECLAAFGNRLVSSLEAKWASKNKQEIAVAVVLASLARTNNNLQRVAYTTEIRTRAQLQHELMAYSYNEPVEQTELHKPKRFKSSIQCHYCGKLGHKFAECHARKEFENTKLTTQKVATPKRKIITCYKCGAEGHISSVCPKKNIAATVEKRVDCVQLVEPRGMMQQNGKCFQFFFDSGAECSMASENTAAKFTGKRYNEMVSLRGLGDATVCCTTQILATVSISNYNLEILFHIVADDILKYNVMIGREILAMGYDVIVKLHDFQFVRTQFIGSCTVNTELNLNNLNTDLIDNDKTKLISILRKYSDSFINGIPQKRVVTGQLEIRLIDNNKTVQRRPYRTSPEERQIMRNRVNELIKANVVRPSSSPFASPALLVKKKDGSDRLCVDYRELNMNTVSDKYPLPLISDQIARLGGANFFTSLDMASGFHQIPVHSESIEKTAFVTPDGQFEYLAMPFGLKNASPVFQRAIMRALGELAYSFVVVYMDDVLIIASSKEEAFERLEIVIETLMKAGFSFNIAKCAFMKTSVEYLGYVVQAGELKPNTRKISALADLPPPQTITQLRQFIGLASYFRMFVPSFSKIMKPLYRLTSEKHLNWKPEHEDVRRKIISILTSHPVLMIFDPRHPVELHTDASAEGYGAILLHKIDGKSHPIEYYSKTTSVSECKYHSYELETLAVVKAVEHFRHYLQGIHFTVFTDCNSLKSSSTKKDLTPRAHRWWAYLQSFDFEVQYREGKRMGHVDFLSRNPLQSESIIVQKIAQKHINIAEITENWLLAEQQRDSEICRTVNKLTLGEMADEIANTFEIRKGILYRKIQRNGRTRCLAIVPRALRWAVINHVHESIMHLGWVKTLDKMFEFYWFEKMSKFVRKFVENCMTCKLSKPKSGKVQAELHPIPKVDIPWHTVHVDITGKLSGKNDIKEYIIVQIDAFTKFVLLYHTLNVSAECCIKSFRSSISLFGVPSRIIADQGRCFAGKDFREFCATQKIDLHLIGTGSSRANGQVERVMGTLKSLLTAVETSQRSWQDALEEIQLALNSTTNQTTKCTPLELLIGKQARPFGLLVPDDVDTQIDRTCLRAKATKSMVDSAQYEKNRFDNKRAKIIKFKVGDFVLIKCEERHQTKLDPKYKGPFKIVEVLEGDRYMLKSMNNKRMYKYAHEFLQRLPSVESITDEDSDIDERHNGAENVDCMESSNEIDALAGGEGNVKLSNAIVP